MSRLLAALLFAGSLAAPALAEDLVAEQQPSTVTVVKEGAGIRINTVNRRYAVNVFGAALKDQTIERQLLLIEETASQVEIDQEESQFDPPRVKVTAFPLSTAGKGAAAFTIEGIGDEVAADGPFLTLKRYGCCVEQETNAVYSLETGKYLFNATGEGPSGQWASLGAKGGFRNERILAYHTAPTAMDDVVFKGVRNAGAVISYASKTEPLQRIVVTLPQAAIDADAPLNWLPKIDLVSAQYPDGIDRIFVERDGDPKTLFTDATLRLVLDDQTKIEIPLKEDRLELKAARLPAGYGLTEIPN